MPRWRVSYRIVTPVPNASTIFDYVIEAVNPWQAEKIAVDLLEDDCLTLFGNYYSEWIRRITTRRLK